MSEIACNQVLFLSCEKRILSYENENRISVMLKLAAISLNTDYQRNCCCF